MLAALLLANRAEANVGSGQTACAHGGNPNSTACENGRNGEVYLGGYDAFNDNAMSITQASYSQGNHLNNELWVYTHSNESQWVEIGVRTGYWVTGGDSCSCGYGHFWADFNSSGEEFLHPIGGFVASGNGTLNYYGVERDSSNHANWDVLYNFNQINISTVQGSSTAYEIQAGLEDTDVSPATSAANFTHSVLEYENTSGNIDDFSYQSTWVDDPCAANGSNKGSCLNHLTPNHTYTWEDSKPS